MNKRNDIREFYLDDFSDCSDSYSVNDGGDENDSNDVIIRKRCGALPLKYSDLEVDDPNNVEVNDDTRSTNEEPRILVSFEGSPGIKIMQSSPESIIDCANLFIRHNVFEYLVRESNRYHYEVVDKYKVISRRRKWTDITVPEIKKFLGLVILMGQVEKNALCDYWPIDAIIESTYFSQVMGRNRFLQTMQS